MIDERAGLLRAVAWHERKIARLRADILRGEEWSAEHNGGRRDLAGTYYTEDAPRAIEFHERSIKAMRRLMLACSTKPRT